MSPQGAAQGGAWITVWARQSFAQAWYADAHADALRVGRDARRREIVFSMCLAESYFYEWFRDQIVPDNEAALLSYFPSPPLRSTTERWKDSLKQAAADGRLSDTPNFSRRNWTDFWKVLEYRNGLVHAGASRPVDVRLGRTSMSPPVPPVHELDALAPGWALNTVVGEIAELHRLIGSQPPDWLNMVQLGRAYGTVPSGCPAAPVR